MNITCLCCRRKSPRTWQPLPNTFFPVLILVGLATRFSALALIGMTLTIQLFVYPDAYPTHGTWLALLLLLVAKGPGSLSIDHLIARRYR